MQHTSDNDFDDLFKSKFEHAAVEPSADLWDKIAPQVTPQRKRALPLLWMAAASVALVVSAMLWFTANDKIQLHAAQVEVVPNKVTPEPVSQIQPEAVLPIVANQKGEGTIRSSSRPTRSSETSFGNVAVIEKPIIQKINELAVQPNVSNEHLPIKKATVEPIIAAGFSRDIENEIMYAQANSATEIIDNGGFNDASNDNRKGLRNVGDLINYVVDRVDRRDRKIVKFDTDDDDNSSIIGLNVGFIKLNKKDR